MGWCVVMVKAAYGITCVFLILCLSACAGRAPLPGGGETSNINFYASHEEMKQKVHSLRPGMDQARVFEILGHDEKEMTALTREEVRRALTGGENAPLPETISVYGPDALQTVEGYRFTFTNVKRKHGFSSPIRIRTDESGFRYTVTLVFMDTVLLEDPMVTGGVVNDSRSRTLFDLFTPGAIMDVAVR